MIIKCNFCLTVSHDGPRVYINIYPLPCPWPLTRLPLPPPTAPTGPPPPPPPDLLLQLRLRPDGRARVSNTGSQQGNMGEGPYLRGLPGAARSAA